MDHLNATYHGPSIPSQKSYHRPSRGGGGCCCLECCCGCVFSLIFKILITVVVLVGIAVLVLWLVFRPHKVTFHVTGASLSDFNLSSPAAGNLRYDLSLNVSIRNPNNRVGIYYDSIEARPFYQDQRFGSALLPTFYQGHDNTTSFTARIQGQSFVRLGESESSDFEADKARGVFGIEVKLYLKTRLKIFWGIKTPKFKPKIKCDLEVPMTTRNGPAAPFRPTKCDVDF